MEVIRSKRPGFYPRPNRATSDQEHWQCLNLIAQFILSSRTTQLISYFFLSKDAVRRAVQQFAHHTICLKYTGGPLIERRRAKRFQVDWQIRVQATKDGGSNFIENGVLRNISSSGALLSLAKPLSKGTQLDVYIKLPLKGTRWMKYPARVVRIERGVAASAAVRFDGPRPDFGIPVVPA